MRDWPGRLFALAMFLVVTFLPIYAVTRTITKLAIATVNKLQEHKAHP